MQIRDRIRELRRVRAADLRPNPKNWRTHPEEQKNALRGILAEIGFANASLARELPDGSLMLIDGHLRAETAPDATVPVLVLDVTDDEADKILATLDPLASMAGTDGERLQSLLEGMESQNEALTALLDQLAEAAVAQDLQTQAAAGSDGDSADDSPELEPANMLHVPLSPAEYEIVTGAIASVKISRSIVSSGTALTAICQEYLKHAKSKDQRPAGKAKRKADSAG